MLRPGNSLHFIRLLPPATVLTDESRFKGILRLNFISRVQESFELSRGVMKYCEY